MISNKMPLALVYFLFVMCVFANEQKDFKKSFAVKEGQAIRINAVSGMNVRVQSWSKNEVMIDLNLEVSCSDKDYERDFIKYFDVKESNRNSELQLTFHKEETEGWSILDIFRLQFSFYVKNEIRGVIYVPEKNSLTADFSYCEISLENLKGELNLPGRSNEIYLKNCLNVNEIKNDYGNTKIIDCAGNLDAESRSSELVINNFTGNARINAMYMDKLSAKEISGKLNVNSRSATITIENIGGDTKIIAPYSDLTVKNIKGFLNIENRSESISIDNTLGLKVDAPYCKIDATNIESKNENIEIGCRSGSISLSKIKGNLLIDDAYSAIDLKSIDGNVRLKSRSENIRCDNINGDINFETEYCSITSTNQKSNKIKIINRSNPVALDLKSNPKEIYIKNDYGDVTIETLSDFGGHVEFYATYGKIKTDSSIRIREQGSSENGSGNIGSGNSEVLIETRSGDITFIRKK